LVVGKLSPKNPKLKPTWRVEGGGGVWVCSHKETKRTFDTIGGFKTEKSGVVRNPDNVICPRPRNNTPC